MSLNRIALIDITGRLCTCNPDGSDFRTLTRSDRIYQFPAWSPDGAWLAAVGSDRLGSGVYVFGDGAQEQQWQLYRSSTGDRKSPFYLYWSPDSRRVSFIANHPTNGIGFHVVDCRSNAESRVLATGQPFFWQWGWDSAEIFIHAGLDEADSQLGFIQAGAPPQRAADHAVAGYFQAPGISADNRYLAYAALDELQQSRVIIESRASGKKLTKPHLGATALTWSPRKNQLAFMAPDDSNTHFYGPLTLLNTDGKLQRLTTESVLGFFWAPDGRKLVYFAPVRESLTGRGSAGSNAARNGGSRHGRGNSADSVPDTAPRQETMALAAWVVDLHTRTRFNLVNFQPTRLFINQFLPFFDQYALSHRIWSPKSDALILPLQQDSKSNITVLPLDQSGNTVLAEGYMGFWSCA